MFRGCVIGQRNPEIVLLTRCNLFFVCMPSSPSEVHQSSCVSCSAHTRYNSTEEVPSRPRVITVIHRAKTDKLPAYSYRCTWAKRAPPTVRVQDKTLYHTARSSQVPAFCNNSSSRLVSYGFLRNREREPQQQSSPVALEGIDGVRQQQRTTRQPWQHWVSTAVSSTARRPVFPISALRARHHHRRPYVQRSSQKQGQIG